VHIEIAGRRIGPGEPTYVIAEVSANHGHSFERAARLVRAAHEAGADAVKLQTYTADTLTIDSDAPPFQIHGGLWGGRTLYDLYSEAYTPWEWQPLLKGTADELGIALFSSPFDVSAVDFLETMAVPAYKVASFELVDTGLLQRVARTGKPVILSTGMATLDEIRDAVGTLTAAGAAQLAVLKCTSAYPSPPGAMHLRTIPHLAAALDRPVGLSDHTLGVAVAVAAVALGAVIVEKHLTLDRGAGGPDGAFSLEPAEFAELVRSIRTTEQALGCVRYADDGPETANRVFRRSLFVVRDVRAGEAFTPENVRSIRPAHGLAPRHLLEVLGRRAARDLSRGEPLSWDMVAADAALPGGA
jgi:pseudaminic acid synthase